MNAYYVTKTPDIKIYQYDVVIGSGAEKRVVQTKVWNSQARKRIIGEDCIYDGNKLAWSLKDYGQQKLTVNLDVEEGRPSNNDKNTFRLHLQRTKILNLAVLAAFLQGKVDHSVDVLEAINFLDHLLREGPSRNTNLVPVRRSFFARNGARSDLGGAIEAFRGVYQSLRPAQGGRLIINLDVANTCFWKPQLLSNTITQKNRYRDMNDLIARLANPTELQATKRYLRKLTVKVKYNGNPQPNTVYKIENVSNLTANTHRIAWRDQQGNETGEKITLTQYFKRKYNVNIQYANAPLIEMSKKIKGNPVYFPLEFLVVIENQRYGAKLDELQTAAMIKFAVAPPAERAKAIEDGKSWLSWSNDKYLTRYGLNINPQRIETKARVLPPPGITFGGNKVEQPGERGRWDLRGKAFLLPNVGELNTWGIGYFGGRTQLNDQAIEKFAMDFTKQYRGHGGSVANVRPHIARLPNDAGQAVHQLWLETGNKFQKRPQILVFVVQNKDSAHYNRIKKSCECRFGVVSQVLQAGQVLKGNPQYYSNVLMKFNAKLGGTTSKSAPHARSGFKSFGIPTCFIGADVSHASPGSEQASMAAITVSFDRHCARYVAGCQTNGHRTEMITAKNWDRVLSPLMSTWASDVGGGRPPTQVYYMRDGVSEGQYIQVMRDEVPNIRAVLDKVAGGKWNGKLTVIIATKRHHVRAFPKGQDGDQKGNPKPGTLIERDVTSLKEFDFYLYSHIALQGTSRPVHYTVLLDEANHAPKVIQNMIYEHCYQYMRSTTSISQHPACYYAHLASKRAIAHEDTPASLGPQSGAGYKQNTGVTSDTPRSSEVPPLLDMNNTGRIKFSMWYI